LTAARLFDEFRDVRSRSVLRWSGLSLLLLCLGPPAPRQPTNETDPPAARSEIGGSEEARAQNRLGENHRQRGELDAARAAFATALAIAEDADAPDELATARVGLGTIAIFRGDVEGGRRQLDVALKIQRALGDQAAIAKTLNILGAVADLSGEAEGALGYFEAALAVAEAAGDPEILAATLNNLGLYYRRTAELERALACFRRGIELLTRADLHHRAAVLTNNVGKLYELLGRPEDARRYLERALEMSQEEGSEPLPKAEALNLLGRLAEAEDPRQALRLHERAFQIWHRAEVPADVAVALLGIGRAARRLGDEHRALTALGEALALARSANNLRLEAAIHHQLGELHLARGELSPAAERFREARRLHRRVRDVQGEASALAALARIARREGKLLRAVQLMGEAFELRQSLRFGIFSQSLRDSATAAVHDDKELAIELLVELHRREPEAGHDVTAFELAERTRAQSLIELLRARGITAAGAGPPELRRKEDRLRRKIHLRENRRLHLLDAGSDPERLAPLEAEIDELLTEYRELEGRIRISDPRWGTFVHSRGESYETIANAIQAEGETLLLELALGHERSFLWLIDGRQLHTFELPGRPTIEDAARRLHALLSSTDPWQAAAPAEVAAARLSEMLLAPVAERLGEKRLLIVSDGALHYVPFGALPDPRSGEPLVAEHEVVRLPSASSVALHRRGREEPSAASKTLAVLADPVFQPDDPRVVERSAGNAPTVSGGVGTEEATRRGRDLRRSLDDLGLDDFRRLPFTREEARRITGLLPPGDSLAALDFEASRERILSGELGRYRILHFATHGLLNSRHPELSGLVLSLVDRQGRSRDGFLRAHELYDLDLAADLVVLSACRTALGKEIRGEGLVGLTRGFLYAGAPAVVVSLWDVSDRATAALMERFYHAMLVDGLRPAAALRRAQLEIRREPRWRSPYFWAGFELQGDWR